MVLYTRGTALALGFLFAFALVISSVPLLFPGSTAAASWFTSLCGGAFSSMVSQGFMGCKLFEAFACLKWVYFILYCIDKLMHYTFVGGQLKMHLFIIFP